MTLRLGTTVALLLFCPPLAEAADPSPDAARPAPEQIEIARAAGPITVDGELDDAGWRGAAPIDQWFETNPGDNVAPSVANVAHLAYDDEFLYAAFRLADPDPSQIRAPFGDRDEVPGHTDYAGVIVDTRFDHRSAQMFLANPRGTLYDAITNDASGEDSAPDFYWEAVGKITAAGWQLELRIPFSSLRYDGSRPEMAVLLYRNHPREYRQQYFSTRLPRERDCFICNATPLVGLEGLPAGSHYVAAPFATAARSRTPEGELGSPLETGDERGELGLDAKWIPNPDLAVDLTLNPDFSQVESDVAQIAANERFALLFPEKRPFFLEGIDLFSTPLAAVYTRTLTAPRWGARATGAVGDGQYTLLVAEDRGGGLAILPGPESSSFAPQDFSSRVLIGRYRHDFGESFASFLVSAREQAGSGHNRVVGPDFRWRPSAADTVAGQLLWADTETPQRPELAAEWDGRELEGHAANLWWYHGDGKRDAYVDLTDVADEFRADNGFMPQVGYRRGFAEGGRTYRPEGFMRRVRLFGFTEYQEDQHGRVLYRALSPGIAMDGRWSSFWRFRVALDEVRSGERLFDRERLYYQVEATPGQVLSRLTLIGWIGDDVDFLESRAGRGASVRATASVRPTDHLELSLIGDRRWLDLDHEGAHGRLLTAQIARLRGTYTFSARAFLRLVGQYVETEYAVDRYATALPGREGGFSGSALMAYKLNWQTVLFFGLGDERALDDRGLGGDYELEPAGQELFLKLSYAFQG